MPKNTDAIIEFANKYAEIKTKLKETKLLPTYIDRVAELWLNNNKSSNHKEKTANDKQYTQLMCKDSTIQVFKGKFPRNQKQYWIYISLLDLYKDDNPSISEKRLLITIVQTLNVQSKEAWNVYKHDTYQEICDKNGYDKEQQKAQYKLIYGKINTFKYYEEFMMKKL